MRGKEREHDFALGYLVRAEEFNTQYRLTERLGLVEARDRVLFWYEFTIRLLRTKIYDSSSQLESPAMAIYAKLPIVNRWIARLDQDNRLMREDLSRLEQRRETYIQENFPTMEARYRARSIELAANDLIAKATPQGQATKMSVFRVNEMLLNDWAMRWQKDLAQHS